MKPVLLAMSFLFYSCYACATDQSESHLVENISHRLIVGSGLQGTFRQEKVLAFLAQPFVSSGEFTLERSYGLHWQVLEPLESLMLVHDSRVVLNGKPVRDHGIGQLMATVMLGIMEGDLSGIEEHFIVTGKSMEDGWYLSLQPKNSRLHAVLDRIDLRGDDYLREIAIHEHGDNRTVIQFTAVQPLSLQRSGTAVAP